MSAGIGGNFTVFEAKKKKRTRLTDGLTFTEERCVKNSLSRTIGANITSPK
jgi:hypothetical protein